VTASVGASCASTIERIGHPLLVVRQEDVFYPLPEQACDREREG
jgi:hypothetical protein